MSHYDAALQATPGLAMARICATAELDPVIGGSPRLTKWGLFCGWESGEARDDFFGDPARLRPFVADARESWSVSMETVRTVLGEWRGWKPPDDGVAPLSSDEPLAVITYGKVFTRYLPAFSWHNAKIVREIAENPAETMRIGLADHPMVRSTFSLWRSKGEMVRYSYGEGLHNPIQRRSLNVPWGTEWFFARFRPLTSTGTWNGRDPLAEMRQSERQPDPAPA